VYTFNPESYEEMNRLTIIKNNNPYFSYHQKLEVVREAIKTYETVVYLDADVEIVGNGIDFNILDKIDPGLHIFATFGSLENSFLNEDYQNCLDPKIRNGKYGKEGLHILEINNLVYKRMYNNNTQLGYLEHYLEGRWIIKKENEKENNFFKIWELLKELTECIDIKLGYIDNIGAGEGAHMSIAAFNSGIRINFPSTAHNFIQNHFISNYQEKVRGKKPWDISG
jgi:hypothetical protein